MQKGGTREQPTPCNLKDDGYHCVLALNTRMYIAISMNSRP
ncbi:Uncharacterised protein [Yersinia enterocolitica]|nr:Uncharacterised protein [Yersinia mollaretii]CNL14819.1 Uncharacterised protein [Yersinia enterocolitica]CQQ27739.1 Uncharacterised protein [Yersinia mollaretii]